METQGGLFVDEAATPLGDLFLVTDGDGRVRLQAWRDVPGGWKKVVRRRLGDVQLERGGDRFGHVGALLRYFRGNVTALDRIPVRFVGTPFQCAVWRALRTIGAGKTASYAEVARRVGSPAAVRAVGRANGSNPIGLIVPCHRVIGSDGSLTGYGGGLERKRWLLEHEARWSGTRATSAAT